MLRVLQLHCHHGLLQIAMGCHDAPEHATSCFIPIACFPALWCSIYCYVLGGVVEHLKGTLVALSSWSATDCYGLP
jgi:hypothetical protein